MIKDALRQLFGRIVSALFGFVITKIIASYLGPLRYGDYGTIFRFFAWWTALVDFGIYVIAVKQLGQIKNTTYGEGENIPKPGIPEGFKVLVKELQALGLDIKLYTNKGNEIELKEDIDDGIDFNSITDSKNNNNISTQDEKELSEGFSTVDVDSEYTDDEESSDELFDDLTDDFEDNLLSDDGDGYEEEDEGFDDNM